jgi:predicted nucleotidyltransferase
MRAPSKLTAEVARARAEQASRILAANPRVRLVYLFGSAVDAPADTHVEDIDLAVLADPPLTLDERLELRADIVDAVGGPIDLVALDAAPIVLAHEVAQTGRCLHACPPEAETGFVVRARARYWDFMPFLAVQWKYAGERLEQRRGSQS